MFTKYVWPVLVFLMFCTIGVTLAQLLFNYINMPGEQLFRFLAGVVIGYGSAWLAYTITVRDAE